MRNGISLETAADIEDRTMCKKTLRCKEHVATVRKFNDHQKMFLLGSTLTAWGAAAGFLCFNVALECPAKISYGSMMTVLGRILLQIHGNLQPHTFKMHVSHSGQQAQILIVLIFTR